MKAGGGLELLGTRNWRSYALLRAGVRLEESNNIAAARKLYIKALQLDPGNRGARVNLATLFLEEGEFEIAINYLRQVISKIEDEGNGNDLVFYSAKYRLASAYFHSGDLKRSEREASELLNTVSEDLRKLAAKVDNSVNAQFKNYLHSLQSMTLVLRFGVRIAAGEVNSDSDISSVDPFLPDSGVQYNLACLYSSLMERKEQEEKTPMGSRSLWHLGFALSLNPGRRSWSLKDPSLQAVRETEPTKKLFQKLVQKYAPVATPPLDSTPPSFMDD